MISEVCVCVCVCLGGGGVKPFFFQPPRAVLSLTKPIKREINEVFAECSILPPQWDVSPNKPSQCYPPSPPPIPAICCQYLFIHLGEERPRKKLYIGNYNTTRDTLKLSHISPAWRLVKLTILKYHLWYLCQISPQIMLLPSLTIYYSVFLNSCCPKHIKLKIIIILLINFDYWLC